MPDRKTDQGSTSTRRFKSYFSGVKSIWRDRTDLAASEWVAKHDRGLDGAEQDEFCDWLLERPRRRRVYLKLLNLWRELDVLADWRSQHGPNPNPDLLANGSNKRSHGTSILIGIAMGLIVMTAALVYALSGPE